MAGIFAVYMKKELDQSRKKLLEKCASRLKHRGPKHTYKYEKFPFKLIFHQKKMPKNNRSLNFSFNENSTKFVAIDGQIYNLDKINEK